MKKYFYALTIFLMMSSLQASLHTDESELCGGDEASAALTASCAAGTDGNSAISSATQLVDCSDRDILETVMRYGERKYPTVDLLSSDTPPDIADLKGKPFFLKLQTAQLGHPLVPLASCVELIVYNKNTFIDAADAGCLASCVLLKLSLQVPYAGLFDHIPPRVAFLGVSTIHPEGIFDRAEARALEDRFLATSLSPSITHLELALPSRQESLQDIVAKSPLLRHIVWLNLRSASFALDGGKIDLGLTTFRRVIGESGASPKLRFLGRIMDGWLGYAKGVLPLKEERPLDDLQPSKGL